MLVLSPIKSFHPSFLNGKIQRFSFSEAPKKIGGAKEFWLHCHKNSDIIKNNGGCLPVFMTFYSTKFPDSKIIEDLGI